MREIKFKVYSEDFKKMFDVQSIDFADPKNLVIDVGLNLYRVGSPLPGRYLHGGDYRTHLIQFTGLKDKNGVEIFEGDILKRNIMNEGFDPKYQYEVVRWNKFVSGFSPFCEYDSDCGGYPEKIEDSQHWGVVAGNIYENPELIK